MTEDLGYWTNFNPATGEALGQYFFSSDANMSATLMHLEQEYQNFKRLSLAERVEGILKLAKLLEQNKRPLSLLMAQEMGKPLRQGMAELDKCILTCNHFAEVADRLVASEEVTANYGQTWVLKKSLGIILAVMPWNFPFWQVIRCAVPAWVAGNVILLKHAPSVQGCALRLQELIEQAFTAKPLIQLPMTNQQTEMIIGDSRIRGLSFTGSTRVGRHLASIAGLHLKKCVLELGGSDPYIILEDADLEHAASTCVKARFVNSGQSCVAAKRFFVHNAVYEPFKARVLDLVSKFKLGDPTSEQTDIGPLAEERLRQGLILQLGQSLELGAKVLQGGIPSVDLMGGRGFYFEPTVVDRVTPMMPIMNEETFGPVMPIHAVGSLEEAIRLSNQTPYGLGAAIFTSRHEIAWQVAADELEAGMVAINDSIQSDPRAPFGGVKDSGWGRELGDQGVLEFANLKTIGIARNIFY